jgi:uncharacterized protein (TIGR02996 family)
MSADLALLADILESPDDDGLRLVYADWLEDHGDEPRAEFIRVQVELARLDEHDPRHRELTRRELHLLSEHRHRWWQELPDWARSDDLVAPFFAIHRGFVREVSADTAALVARADELWQRFPIQAIHLTGAAGRCGALAACPDLARLRELDLHGNGLGSAEVCAIVSSPNLANLERLDLSENGVGDVGARALAEATQLARLTFLDLHGAGIGDAGARGLAGASHLGKLTFLDLLGNPLGPATRAAVRERFGSAALLP